MKSALLPLAQPLGLGQGTTELPQQVLCGLKLIPSQVPLSISLCVPPSSLSSSVSQQYAPFKYGKGWLVGHLASGAKIV